MDLKKIFFILLVLEVLCVSCLNKKITDQGIDPSDATFVSLTFSKNDSIPGLEKAVFTLEEDLANGDSLIVNLDSLTFQTRIDSVFAKFSFVTTSGSYLIQTKEEGRLDTLLLTGSDTLDFTYPATVYNRSADGTNISRYPVKVNVHKVEPELYVWKKLNAGIASRPEMNQKALRFNGRFLFYNGSETETRLYVAEDKEQLTAAWSDKGVLSAGNASSLKLRYMTEHEGYLYVTDNDGKLYRSADGEAWTVVYDEVGNRIYNLLFSVNGALWGITTPASDSKDFRLGMTADGAHWEDKGEIPRYWQDEARMFPVDDYAVLVFRSKTGNPKMLVSGGLNKEGKLSRTSWMSGDGADWAPLRDEALEALQDAALTQYDGKLLLFGGMDASGNIVAIKETLNEGLAWNTPDSACNMLPEEFALRSYQSLILDEEDKRIYLIGGNNGKGGVYSDVWTAKLNRMFFNEE